MPQSRLTSLRFTTEPGYRVTVQIPEQSAEKIVTEVLTVDALKYGDYDSVAFKTALGTQQFRSLGSGRNAPTSAIVTVPCVEVSFFISDTKDTVKRIVEAIYAAHPYEEPVIFVETCLRTLHVRGLDEDNPIKFWNSPPSDWVPEEHQ